MLTDLSDRIRATPFSGTRRLVALVGAPASGKSTLAEALAEKDQTMQVVPMDGFHLDNAILSDRGLLRRKGAPETFDVAGFVHLVKRLGVEDDVVFPLFDRARDQSIAGAGAIRPDTQTVLVEGNYLMLDQPGWRDLAPLWDLSVRIDVPLDVLRDRLLQRWADHGYSPAEAAEKANGNDLPNAALVLENGLPCDVVVADNQLCNAGPPTPNVMKKVE
ncbi:Pantothenate kinase [Sulfitobacter sp. THAF37]|uniref:phosphoribulokinase n=1 Tax=Sulfitobacter sp. THAF37 TaxID=2587855 RepID=UPI0012AA941D|nr:phosphoribulokinase [Sulfitobacter sp. THAF37]QFT59221.1 Pantothenate kinase [Sulfitobacter sp. THAF37]